MTSWDYKVLPSRRASVFGRLIFQFEGVASSDPLKGLPVTGEVEVLEAGESPGMLEDHWNEVPPHVEGYCFLMESKDASCLPGVGLTLYCLPAAMEYVHKAFSLAAQSRAGGLHIGMTLDCPNNPGGAFWTEQWRKEWLRVAGWEISSGAQIRSEAPHP